MAKCLCGHMREFLQRHRWCFALPDSRELAMSLSKWRLSPHGSCCVSALCLLWLFLAYSLADFEGHLSGALVGVDDDVVAVDHFAVQNLERQRILNQLLDGALQGTGAKVRVVSLSEEQFFGGIRELERNLAVGQQTADIFQAQLDDLDQLFFSERPEDDNVVHAVEELGLEVAMQCVHHLLAGFVEIFV